MKLTQRVVLGVVGLLMAYEFWTLINKEEKDTISESVWDWSNHTSFVAFGCGLLCGHWFWPRTINIEINKDGS